MFPFPPLLPDFLHGLRTTSYSTRPDGKTYLYSSSPKAFPFRSPPVFSHPKRRVPKPGSFPKDLDRQITTRDFDPPDNRLKADNMAASASTMMTSSVYLHVVEDVMTKVREEFLTNGGPGEEILSELKGIWESKLIQAGVRLGAADRSVTTRPPPVSAAAQVHDLNAPYEGEEYETPTADMLFPPTPLQTPTPTPLPGSADNSAHNIPTEPRGIPAPIQDAGRNSGSQPGKPNSSVQTPSPWMNQRPSFGIDVNVALKDRREDREGMAPNQSLTQDFFMIASGKRKRDDLVLQYQNGLYIPQRDGAGDIHESLQGRRNLLPAADKEHKRMLARSMSRIPQVDGQLPDPYDDVLSTPNIYDYQGVVSEDYNIASTPAPNELQAATPAPHIDNDLRDDEEPSLNENDDEDDLDDVDEGEEPNTQHLVLAQFDKVTRTKSRWKCVLKEGIMRVNDRDLLFNKATGEFDF